MRLNWNDTDAKAIDVLVFLKPNLNSVDAKLSEKLVNDLEYGDETQRAVAFCQAVCIVKAHDAQEVMTIVE